MQIPRGLVALAAGLAMGAGLLGSAASGSPEAETGVSARSDGNGEMASIRRSSSWW